MREGRDRALWNHTSSLMCLFANINAAKGKRYKPADFNPYSKSHSGRQSFRLTKDTIGLLKVFVQDGSA